MFNSVRLEVARKCRQVTKKALAEAAGIDLRNLSAYENSKYEPSKETVAKISDVLDFPVEWFFSSDLDSPAPDSASFRSYARMSAKKRDSALSYGALAFVLNDFLEEKFQLPKVNLLDLRDEHPENAAITLRQHWGLGERPIKNMVHLLESKGIRVFSLSENNVEVDAFAIWRDSTPFVFLNTLKSSERSRFDAAHELGHLVLHRHEESKGKSAEVQANQFASAFLMPRSGILAHTPAMPSLSDLLQLKKYWIVSVAAYAYRLNSLNFLTEWHYRKLCIEIAQRGYKTKEPNGATREMSLIFPKLFKMLRDDGFRKVDLASHLSMNIEDLDKLVFGLLLIALQSQTSVKKLRVRVLNRIYIWFRFISFGS